MLPSATIPDEATVVAAADAMKEAPEEQALTQHGSCRHVTF